ncbi:unnamed protein product, partial [Didymodactylos carnosus]
LDKPDHTVIVNAMNVLLDENVAKGYSLIGIPLIHLSSNEFIDDLTSLQSGSAIKAYEILKIMTQFALDEKIDANTKSKISEVSTTKPDPSDILEIYGSGVMGAFPEALPPLCR